MADNTDPNIADPDPGKAAVLADEKAQKDTGSSGAPLASTSSLSPPTSPAQSPPLSPPAGDPRRSSSAVEDYYSSRPKFDRLGNPIPERKQRVMSSVYGSDRTRVSLPGDLGPNDPRRPRSPAPNKLPGDLGANDPRRPRSAASSPARPAHGRHPSEGSITEANQRLQEDPPRPEDEVSDDDADADNENDDTDLEDGTRGRGRKRPEPGRTTSGKSVNVRTDSPDSDAEMLKPDPTKGESMLGFKKDLRIKVTPPSEKKRVHPTTAFDAMPSGASTPVASDDEGQIELRAAQKLSLTMSAIHSTPTAHRVIRQIIRGDYAHFQREAEEGRKRQRMYLVATDLSPESQYALEWTIGTVLRDGDTLFAVYAVDEEEGVGGEGGVEIGQGAKSVMDTAAIVKSLPNITPVGARSPGPSPLARSGNVSVSGEGRSLSRGPHGSADLERRRAIEDISQRCIQLLRKTRLQVRVVVEVFHCKSPRHMITEVIDFLSPTLVIIGSRGRSAVKGVLLGSFSNYLVTKSSVPVMVARKKLRKHSKTARNPDGTTIPYSGSGRSGRFSNIIEAPRVKGLRVPGWDKVGID